MSSDNDSPQREQQVADLLRAAAASERAPATLQARVAALRTSARPQRPRPAQRPRLATMLARVAMPVAAVAAAVIVLTLGGGAGTPSIAQAAALAMRAPTASAPAIDPGHRGTLLDARVGSLHFPNWEAAGDWRAVGQRHDRLGNRTVMTVYYAAGVHRVAYSIVSSPALSLPHGLVLASRPPQYTYSAALVGHGRTTVIWEESGHTCLLTGAGLSPAKLWQLASFGNSRRSSDSHG